MPADVALSERRARVHRTIAYYGAFVALGLVSVSLGPTLPGLAEHTRSRLSQVSLLFTARSLGYLLGSFRGGRLYDRMPGHPVMAAALLVMALTAAVVPLMPVLWLVAAVLLLLGMAEGTLDVGGNTLLVWVHQREVGPFMNGLHFSFGLGAFLSPVIIAQAVLRSGDITWAYWALALATLPAAIWLLRLPSPADHDMAEGRGDRRASGLLVALMATFFSLHVAAEVSFGGWIYTYSVAQGLSGETTAAYLTSAFWGALTLGRLLAIPIATRFAPRAMLVGDLAGAMASVMLILLWPGSRVALWVGTFGAGLSIASLFPTSLSLAERLMPIRGWVTGWFLVGASAGGMSLPWLIGQLFEATGPRATMLSIMGDLAVAVAVLTAVILCSTRTQTRQA